MHWYDYGGMLLATLMALWADHDARVAYRASIAVFIRDESALQDWIRGYDLRRVFGPSVYQALRYLQDEGVVERKTGIDNVDKLAHRGGYPDAWFRWRKQERLS